MDSSSRPARGDASDELYRSPNVVVAAIAARQDNVITLDQLRSAGIGRGAIEHRVRQRQMQRLHRAVFLIGAAPPSHIARARAAVLRCGQGAVLSHRTAAEVWKLLPETTNADVHVTVAGRNPGWWPGIRIHRVAELPNDHVRVVRGMKITSPARTIADLRGDELEDALTEARIKRLVSDRELKQVLDHAPRHQLANLLNDEQDDSYTRSKAERLMFKLLTQAELPLPRKNVPLHGYVADFLWEEQKLVVEVDSHRFHGHRKAFESDRKKDQVLTAAGYRVIRITWRQLTEQPLAVAARIAQALKP